MASSENLEAALSRTRQSYDDTPYVHAPMMRSHPGRLAAQAVWRGLAAPDASHGRVLEIGCASGGNLLPMAAAMPDARFLGVDLSPVQIAAGEARRLRYGLENVELRADSFEALGDVDGAFDFIICHGVYSWIPEPLRESLLRVIRERLAPHGIAMVSFNVLPGWRLFQIARDSMLLNARMLDDPSQRAAATRELFKLLAAQSLDKNTYGKFWRDEARHMAAGGEVGEGLGRVGLLEDLMREVGVAAGGHPRRLVAPELSIGVLVGAFGGELLEQFARRLRAPGRVVNHAGVEQHRVAGDLKQSPARQHVETDHGDSVGRQPLADHAQQRLAQRLGNPGIDAVADDDVERAVGLAERLEGVGAQFDVRQAVAPPPRLAGGDLHRREIDAEESRAGQGGGHRQQIAARGAADFEHAR